MNKIFVVLYLLIQQVYAQQSLIKKEEVFSYGPLETTAATLYPNITLKGFIFNKITFKNDLNCKEVDPYDMYMAAFFSSKNKLDNNWEDILAKCYSNLDTNMVELIFLYGNSKTLEEFEISKSKFLKKLKRKSQNITSSYKDFNNLVAEIEKKETRTLEDKKNILQKIEKMDEGVLKNLLKAYLAFDWKNPDWQEESIQKIINTDLHQIIFEFDFQNDFIANKTQSNIFLLLNKMKESLKEGSFNSLLIQYFTLITKNDEIEKLLSYSGGELSLKELREISNSYTKGIKNIGLWFFILNNRTFKQEVLEYMKNNFTFSNLRHFAKKFDWLLQYFRPSNIKIREYLIDEVLQRKETLYTKFLWMSLLNYPEIKKVLIEKNKNYKKASFVIKRNFFRNAAEKGQIFDFSMYNLYKLGDRDTKLFWRVL